jgi:hypothetical protein
VNDIVNAVPGHNVKLFADYTNLFMSGRNIDLLSIHGSPFGPCFFCHRSVMYIHWKTHPIEKPGRGRRSAIPHGVSTPTSGEEM